VVDNGSSDGSIEQAESAFPFIRAIRLPENRGAGGARNVGLQEAKSDRIVFIDNDVALTDVCIERLTQALADHPAAALAAASVVYAHRRDTIQYDGAECHFLGLQTLLDENLPIDQVKPAVRKVGSIVTCCFLADRARLPAHERFDETFFYIFEDHDFGVRVRAQGPEILSVPNAFCYHGKGTEGLSIRQLGEYSRKRVYYIIRNRALVLLKNFSLRTLIVLAPMLFFYDLAQFLTAVRKGWFREWWTAQWWIVTHLGWILRERRRIQSLRRVPDRQLLVGGPIPFRSELTTSALERFARRVLEAVAHGYWKLAAPLI
jgi:GT2 family glycosyltransferase